MLKNDSRMSGQNPYVLCIPLHINLGAYAKHLKNIFQLFDRLFVETKRVGTAEFVVNVRN